MVATRFERGEGEGEEGVPTFREAMDEICFLANPAIM